MNPEKILSTLLQASAAFESAMRRLNPLIVSEIRRDLLVHLEPLTAVRRFLHDPGATMNNTVQSGLLRTCDFLAAAIKNFGNEEDLQAAFISALRAGRKHCRALEALFPLCHAFPEVNRYFLEEKKESAIRSEPPASTGETGIFQNSVDHTLLGCDQRVFLEFERFAGAG